MAAMKAELAIEGELHYHMLQFIRQLGLSPDLPFGESYYNYV
jgi:hypothetical protein